MAALDELLLWTADDHQWSDAQWRDWDRLLRDLLAAYATLPRDLKSVTSDPSVLRVLRGARQRLSAQRRQALDPALRTALTSAEMALRKAAAQPEALRAAWADLVRAARRTDVDREEAALALLVDLTELQGQPWAALSRRLWSVLGDDHDAIAAAKAELTGQAPPARVVPPSRAGADPSIRLELAAQLLTHPPIIGDVIVWLGFERAHVAHFKVEVGPNVLLVDGRWLRSVLAHWDTSAHAHADVPREVAEHRDDCLEAWSPEPGDEDLPFALMRVVLGRRSVAGALEEARATAEVLLRLASFYNCGRQSWPDSRSYIVFVDDSPDWRTLGIGGGRREDGWTLSLAQDRTADVLGELASTVSDPLPVRDGEVKTALELLRWLLTARAAWQPARVLLLDRVLAQVGAWAGSTDGWSFARDYLALPWAYDEAKAEIADAGIQAVYSIDRTRIGPSEPARRDAFLEAVGPRGLVTQQSMENIANCREVLKQLSWLQSWQVRGTDAHARLAALERRVSQPQGMARWITALVGDFERLLDRARRTRNALAHGGPISEPVVLSVLRFTDEVASDALNHALYARMTGTPVADQFVVRQRDLERRLKRLREPEHVVTDVLFGDPLAPS